MCVAQFRDYCNAYQFKDARDISKNDEVDKSRGSFRGGNRTWLYCKNNAAMNKLKAANNAYALAET